MPLWLTSLAVFAGSWAVLCSALALWARRAPEPDERHSIETEDGWVLTLHRFLPGSEGEPQAAPLIFAHGLNMNRACWVLSSRGDLLRAMAARGHDVFAVEYRGTSESRPGSGSRWRYDIDDHVEKDIPALIDAVCRIAGSEQVHWVGHSMGGMLLYLYSARHGSDRIRRSVTLGSPARLKLPPLSARLGWLANARLVLGGRVHLQALFFLTLPFAVAFGGFFTRSFLNPAHTNARERATLSTSAVEDVSTNIHHFFLEMARNRHHLCPGTEEGVDGVELDGLKRLETPLLVVSGSLDRIAPPRAAEPAFERAGASCAAYRCLGSEAADSPAPAFGHCDLASSEAALQHVVPLLAGWLEGEVPTIEAPDRSRGLQSSKRATS